MILRRRKKAVASLFLAFFVVACSDTGTTVSSDTDTGTGTGTGTGTDTGTGTGTGTGTDTGTGTGTGTDSTIDINTGNWILNSGDERSLNIFEENSNTGVLVNITSVSTETIGEVEYISVETSSIPNYRATIDQETLDILADRPLSSTDFINGTPDISVGDVVEFGQNIGYLSSTDNCNDTGGYGYFAPGPSCPIGVELSRLFTTEPVEAAAGEECDTGLGAIGLFASGASIYDWNDGQSYENEGVWQHTASRAEIHDMDICFGHMASEYHHHNYSGCLAEEMNDTGNGHSPAYGVSADGFPVHGPWHANGTLVISSWLARDYDNADSATGCGVPGERSCTLVDNYDITQGTTPSNSGPSTSDGITSRSGNPLLAESGLYFQDYYHDPALSSLEGAYLDKHNGHNHDDVGYHYHLTVTEDLVGSRTLVPAFPFTFGPTFKGELDDNALRGCGGGDGEGGGGPGEGGGPPEGEGGPPGGE